MPSHTVTSSYNLRRSAPSSTRRGLATTPSTVRPRSRKPSLPGGTPHYALPGVFPRAPRDARRRPTYSNYVGGGFMETVGNVATFAGGVWAITPANLKGVVENVAGNALQDLANKFTGKLARKDKECRQLQVNTHTRFYYCLYHYSLVE